MKGKTGCCRYFWVTAAFLVLCLGGLYLFFHTERAELDQEAKVTAPGSFITLPEGEAHYLLSGPTDGLLVVLVHGFSVPSYVWEPTISGLADSGFQVLVYDLFGRGYSQRVDADYDIDLFTDQLAQLIGALEIDTPVVVGGLSMGAPIAARFANQYPDQVKGVILIAPEVVQVTPGDIFPLNLPLIGEYLMTAVMEPFLLPGMQLADFAHPENYPDWEDRYRFQLQFKGTGRALLSTVRELTGLDAEAEYGALGSAEIPVQLIWGESDQTIGREQIEVLEWLVPEMQIEIIPGAGHLPHYEKPELVNPVLIGFLDDLTIAPYP